MRMDTGLKVCIEKMTVLIELYIQNEFCTHLFSLTSSICQAIRRGCYTQGVTHSRMFCTLRVTFCV